MNVVEISQLRDGLYYVFKNINSLSSFPEYKNIAPL